jgi:endonuclease YncB( thermonuclease family)
MNQAKKNKIIFIFVSILTFLLLAFAFWIIIDYETEDMPESGVYVIEVIDGDTFKMSDSSIVRLLCADTPEQGEDDYERSKKFLESLILYRNVRLVGNETDKYNRDLRFVYVSGGGGSDSEIFVNREIVRLGFGSLFEYGDSDCSLL